MFLTYVQYTVRIQIIVRFLMSDTDLPRRVCEVSPAELADGKKMDTAMQTTRRL